MPRIPDRWTAYAPMGKIIAGTRFICFKVPLKDALCRNLQVDERFTPEMLMQECPKLGLVVDLTNTSRYYNGQVFQNKGIQYKKIICPGHIVPPGTILKEFFKTVDAFLKESDEQDKLIGVHCTHGLNRTGYFICRYLNIRMGFTPQDAISAFEDARGHKIERQPYIEEIVSEKEVPATETDNESDIEIIEAHQHVYKNQPTTESSVGRTGKSRHREDSPSNDRSYKPAKKHDFDPDYRPGGSNKFYHHQQDPQYRRNNLMYESPLASSSYDDINYSSRYSRGYGPQRSRGSYERSSQHMNHPYRRPENYDYSSGYRGRGSNHGQFNGRGYRDRAQGSPNPFKWDKQPMSDPRGRDGSRKSKG